MVLLSLLFGLVYNFAALLAGAYRLAIYFLMCNAGSLAACWANQHNLCCKHRSLLHEDATLWGTLIRLGVALYLVNALNYNQTTRILDEAAEFDGYVLIDAPGALVFPGLAPILQIADAVAIPFGYDYNVLKSTLKFIQVLMSDEIGKEKDRLFFIPNRVEEHIGTKEEKEQAERANAQLANLGRVTYRVKKGVAVQRYSTLTYTTYQMKATQAPWTTITNKLSRLK